MSSSSNDFSAILDLMDVKRLYEEQEEKWAMRLREKEDQVQNVRQDLEWRERELGNDTSGLDEELARAENDKEALIKEAQAKIAALNTRLADLQKRLPPAK